LERRWRDGGGQGDAEDLIGDVGLNRDIEREESMERRELQKGDKMNEDCRGLAGGITENLNCRQAVK
jgi:hypothetical protein